MGRPTKLTEERQGELCRYLRDGNAISTACALVGIDESTYHKWQQRGRAELERVEEGHVNCRVRKEEAPYVEFFKSAMRARAEGEQRHVKNIQDASSEDWRASAWFLERSRPERWGKKQKLEHTGEGGGPVQTESTVHIFLPDNGRMPEEGDE